MRVSILYPVSLAMCVCLLSVSLLHLAVKVPTNSVLLAVVPSGVRAMLLFNPSRQKLQELATGNFQVEQIRRSIGYGDLKSLSTRYLIRNKDVKLSRRSFLS